MRHRTAPIENLLARAVSCVVSAGILHVCLAAEVPPIGGWDGVTESARLEGPYEDPDQFNVPFGSISYFNHPWRGYMDTWPARRFLELPATQWNADLKYAGALCQILEEVGIASVRVEMGWGSTITWDDEIREDVQNQIRPFLRLLQAHQIRPLFLLNAHHGVPCPMRTVHVEVVEDARRGDRTLKVRHADGIRPGHTGIPHPQYIAAYPLVTRVDDDGTLHLSDGLGMDIPAGRLNMQDLKYQPFQGSRLVDGTPVPEAQDTFDGWLRYAAAVGHFARDALGTAGQPDAGFDIEVWNEQTFGSNFLDINRYYREKREYAERSAYSKTRAMQPHYRPDAQLEFHLRGFLGGLDAYNILPMTIDYFNDPKNGFPGVRVMSGFANQWPWDSGSQLWDGQAGFSRHFYTGGWFDCSPENPIYPRNRSTIDALGNRNDTFVPTFRYAFPEFYHTGFKTECISRDVMPDSRLERFKGHGRYTHNGDYRIAEVWQTEVNYDRSPFIGALRQETGAGADDPRLAAFDQHLADKMLLRQYFFHGHKGLRRLYIYSIGGRPGVFGMLPGAFYAALDESNGHLTDAVREQVPAGFIGLGWFTSRAREADEIEAARPLRVEELIEHKPRLVFAGEGTVALPHRWNRDQFAFLPYQFAADDFIIPYYVMTLDVTHVWDDTRDLLDPARYDMPAQAFDVTIGNVAGEGAAVSVHDPLTHRDVPVTRVAATDRTLTVRLQAVDYPRYLRIREAKPGPQILKPDVSLKEDGSIAVSWDSNVPVDAHITHGRDWPNRGDHRIDLPGGNTRHAVTIPPGQEGVVAVRIHIRADGLYNVWPRWDEDPAGQIVVPARH